MKTTRLGALWFLLFIPLLAMVSSLVKASGLDDVLRRVSARCPSMKMKGIDRACGGLMQATNDNESVLRNVLVGGLGYDRFGHEMKGQVLKSRVYTQAQGERFLSKVMQDPRSLYDFFYPMDLSNNFYNGLYSRNLGSTQLYNSYFKGNMKVTVAQKQYLSYNAVVTSNSDLTDEFKEVLSFLPDVYNPDVYQRVIDYFGDLVTTTITFGGVIDQMSSIKYCYGDPSMLRYVEQQLDSSINTGSPRPPNGFIDYARADQLTIVGGNPQEGNIHNRIRSFPNNPSPILFSAVPIWTVFPAGPKRDNMKRAYDDFVNNFSRKLGTEANYLQSLINEEYLRQEEVTVYYSQLNRCDRGSIFGGDARCAVVGGCRKGCSVQIGNFRMPNGQNSEATVSEIQLGGLVITNTGQKNQLFRDAGRIRLKVARDEAGVLSLYSELYRVTKRGWDFLGHVGYVKPGVQNGCIEMSGPQFYYGDARADSVVLKACLRCIPLYNPDGSSVPGCGCPKL